MADLSLDTDNLHYIRSFQTNNTRQERYAVLHNHSALWLLYSVVGEQDLIPMYRLGPAIGLLDPKSEGKIKFTRLLKAQRLTEDVIQETFQLQLVFLAEEELRSPRPAVSRLWAMTPPERRQQLTFQVRFSRDYHLGNNTFGDNLAARDVEFNVTRTSGRGLYRRLAETAFNEGGYGKVYKAELRFRPPTQDGGTFNPPAELWTSVPGALKVLTVPSAIGDDLSKDRKRALRRFHKEIYAWMGLEHDNIAPLLGWHVYPDPGMVTPWYDNGTARDYLQKPGKRSEWERIITEVSSAVMYLHQGCYAAPVVHGDIKGNNILIDANGQAKLSDFGMSFVPELAGTQETSLQSSGNVLWTSPETYEGVRRSIKSDMYALASTILELSTGKLPFGFGIRPTVFQLVKSHPSPGGSRSDFYKPELPKEHGIWPIIEPCWQEAPEKRPTIGHLHSQLLDLLRPEKK